jgi:hypothetical protein
MKYPKFFMAIECGEFFSGDNRVCYELNFQRSGTFSKKRTPVSPPISGSDD